MLSIYPLPPATIEPAAIGKAAVAKDTAYELVVMTDIHKDWPVILDHFPMLADWPSQKVTWADLMFTESEIIIGTMLELMHSYGIPCFSVHDSIIVRKSDQQIAMDTLKDQFFKEANIEPRLKVK